MRCDLVSSLFLFEANNLLSAWGLAVIWFAGLLTFLFFLCLLNKVFVFFNKLGISLNFYVFAFAKCISFWKQLFEYFFFTPLTHSDERALSN